MTPLTGPLSPDSLGQCAAQTPNIPLACGPDRPKGGQYVAMTLIVMDLSWSRPEREEGERDREERRGIGTEKRGGGEGQIREEG